MQDVASRCKYLVTAIRSAFSSKRLAVIIDDVWNLDKLEALDIALDCSSSILVTSREDLPGAYIGYDGVKLTGEDNKNAQDAILASYVAADPQAKEVPSHLKVRPATTCYFRQGSMLQYFRQQSMRMDAGQRNHMMHSHTQARRDSARLHCCRQLWKL